MKYGIVLTRVLIKQSQEFSPTEYFQTTEEMLSNAHNRLKEDQLKTLEIIGLKKKQRKAAEVAVSLEMNGWRNG